MTVINVQPGASLRIFLDFTLALSVSLELYAQTYSPCTALTTEQEQQADCQRQRGRNAAVSPKPVIGTYSMSMQDAMTLGALVPMVMHACVCLCLALARLLSLAGLGGPLSVVTFRRSDRFPAASS